MKNALVLLPALVLLQNLPTNGQEDTAHHREVYAGSNEKAATYKTVSAEIEEDHAAIKITGWSDGGELRKIVATIGGEHGIGTEEYYLEDGKPLFLYTVHTTEEMETGKLVARQEDRFYLKDGELFKWLSGKEAVDPGSDEFSDMAGTVAADFARYKVMLEKKMGAKADAGAAHAVGKFTGIEQGDYFHWNMTAEDGTELSYYILDGGVSVGKVLENPEAFLGRKCRVNVATSMEEIPEAGGKNEITQIKGVEWFE